MNKDIRIITKESFETLVGSTISDSDFSKIKKCFELLTTHWKDENDLAWSFRRFGMEHFDHIFSECVRIEKKLIESGEISGKYASFSDEKVRLEHDGHFGDDLDEETHEDESGICQSVDMAALKEHFEFITNCTVTDNEYNRIEKCINAFSGLLTTDNDIALFYHTFGMDGIDRLNCHITGDQAELDYLREGVDVEHGRYLDMRSKYNQLSSYITAFLKAMVKFFNEILSDPLFKFDYSVSVFHALIDYLNKEIERFESEVK